MAIKYFIYSDEQVKERNTVLAKSGKTFVPGTVIINGKRYKFTQISDTSSISRFVDCKVIAKGDLSDFTYTNPSTKNKRGN